MLPLRGSGGAADDRCLTIEGPMKLTDTQLVLLSAASQRDDRALEIPDKLRGGAAQKVAAKLVAEGLVEEVRSRGGLPVWRRDASDGPRSLRLTKQGLTAIGVEDEPAQAPANERNEDRPPQPVSKLTAAPKKTAREKQQRKSRKRKRPIGQTGSGPKQAAVIVMLSRPRGATVPVIMHATGWQQHSVRGFFAGVVRKKLDLDLVSEKVGSERIYRIVAAGAGKATG